MIIGGILVLFIYEYMTRLASNKVHREVGRAKDLSAPPVHSCPIPPPYPNPISEISLLVSRLPEFARLSFC